MKEANEKERDLLTRTVSSLFSVKKASRLLYSSSFFAKGEGTETIDKLSLNYCFKSFSQKSLNPLFHFPGIFPLIYLVGVP